MPASFITSASGIPVTDIATEHSDCPHPQHMANQFGEDLSRRQLLYRWCPAERWQRHGVKADGDEDTERYTLPQFHFGEDVYDCTVQQCKHDRKLLLDVRDALGSVWKVSAHAAFYTRQRYHGTEALS